MRGFSRSVFRLTIVVCVASISLARAADAGGATAASHPATPATTVVVPGEVLVAVDGATDVADIARAVSATSARRLRWSEGVALLHVPGGDEGATARRLAAVPGVRWAAPNELVRATAVPNDPGYPRQWNLGTRERALGAANWQPVHGTATTAVTVAVLDTGVTPNEDLDQVTGIDLVDGDADPSDPNGHGTHVAGTVAQSTGNGIGVAGVAGDAPLLAVRVLDAAGTASSARVIEGIGYAVEQGARVVNLSLAGARSGGLCDAVASAVARGVVVVASAGNDGGPVTFPAACPGAIAVSATTIAGQLGSYSNRGPEVTLAAPGGDNSTDLDLDGYPDGILQYTVRNGVGGYYFMAGTSMAAPHVSGAAALLLGTNPALTAAGVREALTSTAVDLGAPGRDDEFGAGLLNIAAAVAAATPESPPTEVSPPPAPAAPAPAGPSPSPSPAEPEPTPETGPVPEDQPHRLAGASRFDTSVAVSREGWAGGSIRVYLASGRDFPDALATGALAEQRPGPLLLTEPCRLPPEVSDELARLGPAEVIAVGGEQAVCTRVLAEAAAASGAAPRRLAGTDRYATAVALASEGFSSPATVYLASGEAFPDGLAGAATAAEEDAPLLLTARCSLPASTRDALARLAPGEVVVVGGTASVCEAVDAEVRQAVPQARVVRVAGETRYATAAALVDRVFGSAQTVFVASGVTFPDALSAGPLAAVRDAPVLLVAACSVPVPIEATLERLAPGHVTVLGGPAAVCEEAAASVSG